MPTPGAPAALVLRFVKDGDGPATLTLLRADGSATRSPIGPSDGFGPIHDFAHFVVEGQLALVDGFLGLIARGWTLRDFDVGAAARIWPDAIRAEAIAGLLALEAMAGGRLPLAEFNDTVAAKCGAMRAGYQPAELTPTALNAMRAELAGLCRQWAALGAGATLELRFDPSAVWRTVARAPLGHVP
jgi:hypothetical protein